FACVHSFVYQTLAFSYLTGTIASFYNTESVLIAVAITAALCLAISLFAIQTRIDFTKCTALLFVLSMVVLLTGLACIIVYAVTGSNNRVWSLIIALVVSCRVHLYMMISWITSTVTSPFRLLDVISFCASQIWASIQDPLWLPNQLLGSK
ncbi:uncharacterized protein DEA37_0014756, partial [Paragonimus westermani]